MSPLFSPAVSITAPAAAGGTPALPSLGATATAPAAALVTPLLLSPAAATETENSAATAAPAAAVTPPLLSPDAPSETAAAMPSQTAPAPPSPTCLNAALGPRNGPVVEVVAATAAEPFTAAAAAIGAAATTSAAATAIAATACWCNPTVCIRLVVHSPLEQFRQWLDLKKGVAEVLVAVEKPKLKANPVIQPWRPCN
ncbi:unnamed protein product [Closterium sp. NIES-54]